MCHFAIKKKNYEKPTSAQQKSKYTSIYAAQKQKKSTQK